MTAALAPAHATAIVTSRVHPAAQPVVDSESPRLALIQITNGNWQLVWSNPDCVLQESATLEVGWTDVAPSATSPFPVTMETDRFYRLRVNARRPLND